MHWVRTRLGEPYVPAAALDWIASVFLSDMVEIVRDEVDRVCGSVFKQHCE
jgi:hypothetical protein